MPISLDEFSFTFEVPNIEDIPEESRDEVLADIGEYLLDSVLDYVGSSKSPVAGGKFKKELSEAYSKIAGKDQADLDLTGSMLDNLTFFTNPEDGTITLEISNSDEIPKAYNHNVGDTLPERKFLPDDSNGETFKAEIIRGVGRILEDYLEE